MEYDKNNNDTYEKLYSYGMAQDVEVHMFKSNTGSVSVKVLEGYVYGNFTHESRIIANNNVLHFSKLTNLKHLKLLKHKELSSIVPLSLIERYKLLLTNITHTQKTPIFYDINKDMFVRLADNRVLRDLKRKNIDPIALFKDDMIKVESDSEHPALLLYFKSLKELYDPKSELNEKVHNIYVKELTNFFDLKDVIILKYLLQKKESSITNKNFNNYLQFQDKIFNTFNSNFEFVKAKEIGRNYYFIYDKNDELNISKNFYFKDEVENNLKEIHQFSIGEQENIVFIPYNATTWNNLIKIKHEMSTIIDGLYGLFNNTNDNTQNLKKITL